MRSWLIPAGGTTSEALHATTLLIGNPAIQSQREPDEHRSVFPEMFG
jgi:hypothetical protein